MKTEALQYFVTVAQTGSIAKAAARLSVNRSTMSMALAALEDQLGVSLFTRTGNSMQLAPAGERILDDSIRLVNLCESIKRRCLDDGLQLPHRLVIGRDDALPEAFWRQLISKIRKCYPNMALEMHYASASILQQRVAEGRMDLACCLHQSVLSDTQLSLQVLGRIALHMVIAKRHRLAHMGYVSHEDLATVAQIGYVDLHQDTAEPCDIALSSFELIRDAIRDELGWGYVPEPLLQDLQQQDLARVAHGYNVTWLGYVALSQQNIASEPPVIAEVCKLIDMHMQGLLGVEANVASNANSQF